MTNGLLRVMLLPFEMVCKLILSFGFLAVAAVRIIAGLRCAPTIQVLKPYSLLLGRRFLLLLRGFLRLDYFRWLSRLDV